MFKDLDYNLKAQANNIPYELSNKIEIVGTIVFIGLDVFKSGGGVYTFMIRSDSTVIAAKLYYKKPTRIVAFMDNPFNKGDVVRVVGKLKDNKFKGDDLEIIDKGKDIIIDPFGIAYHEAYLDKLSQIAVPEISFEQMIDDNMMGITSQTVKMYSKEELASFYRGIKLEVSLNREVFKSYYRLKHMFNPGGITPKKSDYNINNARYDELFAIYYGTMV